MPPAQTSGTLVHTDPNSLTNGQNELLTLASSFCYSDRFAEQLLNRLFKASSLGHPPGTGTLVQTIVPLHEPGKAGNGHHETGDTVHVLVGDTVQLVHTVDWHVRPLFKA